MATTRIGPRPTATSNPAGAASPTPVTAAQPLTPMIGLRPLSSSDVGHTTRLARRADSGLRPTFRQQRTAAIKRQRVRALVRTPGFVDLGAVIQAAMLQTLGGAPADRKHLHNLQRLVGEVRFHALDDDTQLALLNQLRSHADDRPAQRALLALALAPGLDGVSGPSKRRLLEILDAAPRDAGLKRDLMALVASRGLNAMAPADRGLALDALALHRDNPEVRAAIIDLVGTRKPTAEWAAIRAELGKTGPPPVRGHDLSLQVEPTWSYVRTGGEVTFELTVGDKDYGHLDVYLAGVGDEAAAIAETAKVEELAGHVWQPISSSGMANGARSHRVRVTVKIPEEVSIDTLPLRLVVWDHDEPDERAISTEPIELAVLGNVKRPPPPSQAAIAPVASDGISVSMTPTRYAYRAGEEAQFELEVGLRGGWSLLGVRLEGLGPQADSSEAWSTIDKRSLELVDGERAKVVVRVKVPADAKPGAHALKVVVWDHDNSDERYVHTAPIQFAVQ